MNLVSGFVGEISPNLFGGKNAGLTQGINLEDKTFADLLEKKLNSIKEEGNTYLQNMLGIPSGFQIEGLNANDMAIDSVKPVNPANKKDSVFDKTTSETLTFFNTIFDSKPSLTETSSNPLYNYARKFAAGFYNKYAGNVVTNLEEFVSDTLKLS